MSGVIRHEACFYDGTQKFLPSCLALMEDAVSEGRPLILLAGRAKLAAVRDALGETTGDVTFVPTDESYRNPARVTTLLDRLRAISRTRRAVGVTDWGLPARSSAALIETQLAESLLNSVAVRSWPLDVVCLYDTSTPGGPDMRRVHPYIRGEPGNADYEPNLAAELFAGPLVAGPPDTPLVEIDRDGLSRTRDLVRAFAKGQGLPDDRMADFVLAANEIVTNSIRHGGGRCRIALWQQDGSVVCEVVDAGRIRDPLAGRIAPSPSAPDGRGLWLANHLCDLVQIRSSAAGTVVRLYMDRL
jgi:anti-sigma regulatory factor (Ser/Thr protein kinase)